MKKNGFTLAEVLITLSILGVVSALTLPMLSTKAQDQANAAKLSSAVTELENAFGLFLLKEDEMDLSNILSTSDPNSSLAEFMKTSGKVNSVAGVYGSNSPFKNSNNTSYTVSSKGIFMTKAGAIVFINDNSSAADGDANGNVDNYIGDLHIDVNGATKPNKIGKDLFSFHLGTDGILYPKDDKTKALAEKSYKAD